MVSRAFPIRVVVSLALALGIVGGIVVAGAALRRGDNGVAQSEPSGPTTSTSTSTTTTLPPTTTTIPALIQPPPAVLPPATTAGFRPGSRGPEVQAYEQRLLDVHLDPGPIDGVYDQKTVYAVQAIQKLAGFPRTGVIGPGEAAYLSSFQYPLPLHPSAEPNHVEIDVTKQVITVYENYQVRLITTTSTASGVTYCYNTPKRAPTQHICEVATTPSGRYAFYLFRSGWDKGDLGALYNPYYFNKGRAIHGYQDVPPEPASHGCARIPMHISEYFHTLVTDGEAVYVDGGPPGETIISSSPIGHSSAPQPAPTPDTAPPDTTPPTT